MSQEWNFTVHFLVSLFLSWSVTPTGMYSVIDIYFEFTLSSLSSLPMYKWGPWLSLARITITAICTEPFLFWSKCPLSSELAFQMDCYTELSFSFPFHLSSQEICLILNILCVFIPVCICSCNFLILEKDLQTFISTTHLSKSQSSFRNQLWYHSSCCSSNNYNVLGCT